MPLLLEFVRPVGECRQDLEQHMVATQAERRRLHRYARGGALNSWVKMAQPGETVAAIASMKTSMPSLSSAGSQHVSMNVRCPLTMNGSNAVSEAP
jgi:hypothetical protein